MYEVIFDAKAIEFLEKSEKHLAKRIWDKIMSTENFAKVTFSNSSEGYAKMQENAHRQNSLQFAKL